MIQKMECEAYIPGTGACAMKYRMILEGTKDVEHNCEETPYVEALRRARNARVDYDQKYLHIGFDLSSQ